jgi:hypothetical protein
MAKRGQYDAYLVPILTNVYNIPERLRELDEGYFVMMSRATGRFEIHHDGMGDVRSYQLTVPFMELDARTVDYVRRTHVEHINEIMQEAARQNYLAGLADSSAQDARNQQAKEILRYMKNHESITDVPPEALNPI